jgi:hypothetical protein
MKVTTGNHYLAFVLSEECVKQVKAFYTSRHPVVKCHHVTIAYNFTEEDVPRLQAVVNSAPTFMLSSLLSSEVVDLYNVCVGWPAVDSYSMPMATDQSYTHLTLAHAEGARASDSNRVLKQELPSVRLCGVGLILTGEFQLIEKRA